MKTTRVATWFLVALGWYDRLTQREIRVLLDLARRAYDGRPRPDGVFYVVTRDAAYDLGMHRKTWERALRTLLDQGLVTREIPPRDHDGKPGPVAYRLTDWRAWAWKPESSQAHDPIQRWNRLEAAIEKSRRGGARRQPAHRLAQLLRYEAAAHGCCVPIPSLDDPAWRRWCAAIDRLLERGYGYDDLRHALGEMRLDPTFGGHLHAMGRPDEAFELLAPDYLVRYQERAFSRGTG